ncbi:MAG: hypothetical protein B1H05_04605 [Candidatus Cloacimonas sp. 4484_140]|nr:MAG: hypothetical protein B1H05_04605 [Candidatus Cloacimonas sp. 4484_140]
MDLISKLQDIGLTGREAEIYITMLQKKEFKAPEIAKITTISRTKIYEVLQNLINKGACSEKQENGQKIYSAIEPDIAINNILSVQQQEVIRREKIGVALEKELTSICKKNSSKNDPLVYVEVLTDREQIRRKCSDFQKNAKKEILAFTKAPYTTTFKKYVNEEVNALKRKIEIRSIYEYRDIVKDEFLKGISFWVSAGEKAKVIKELPIKMVIFDEKITVLAMNDPISLKPSITTMIIKHPSFAKTLKYVFENIWKEAMTLEEYKIKEKIQ